MAAQLDPTVRDVLDQILARLKAEPGPLLVVLHAAQEAFGHIPPASVPVIAEALNLSHAEVHGVISFYHYFRTTPPGRHRLFLCRAEACQSMHGKALESHAEGRLGITFHETTADGHFSLEPVYCLGNCALSPAVMIDDALFGRVTPARFDALIAERSKA